MYRVYKNYKWCSRSHVPSKNFCRRLILTVDQNGQPIQAEPFRLRLSPPPGQAQDVGASIRWAVAAADDKSLRLEMQYLPAPLSIVSQKGLNRDNAPAVLLAVAPLQADMFDGITHAGVVPYFFAPSVPSAVQVISSDTEFVFNTIKTINGLVLHMHHIPHAEAMASLVQGGTIPVSLARQAFQSTWLGPSSSARQRPEPTGGSREESGRKIFPVPVT